MTATGLNLLALGGMQIAVDGQEVELSQTMGYKGMMLSGVPNMGWRLDIPMPRGRSSAT